MPLDQVDHQLRIVGEAAHQLLERRGRCVFVPELVVERDHAPSELDVARRRRERGPGGRQRPFQIAERVAHPAEHVPFDGARRAFQLARQLGQRAAVASDRERERPDRTAPLGITRRQLAQQCREGARDEGGVGRIAAGQPQARGAQGQIQLRDGVTGAEPRLQDLGASHGLAGVFQRVRQALGDLVAVRFRAGQIAQQRDGSVLGGVVGGVPGARQDAERGLDEAAARRCAVLELQRIVVCGQRPGVVARVREGARSPRERRNGLRRRPQDLIERGGRGLRVTERLQQVSIGSERRVRRLAAFSRRTFGARAKPLAQLRPTVAPRQLDEPRARSSSSGRSSSARSARSTSALESVR